MDEDCWSPDILKERTDLDAWYEFGDLKAKGREKILAEFFAGKLYDARRCGGDNKVMRNAYRAVIAKLKYFLRERKYKKGHGDEVRLVENALRDENVPLPNEGFQLESCISNTPCLNGNDD